MASAQQYPAQHFGIEEGLPTAPGTMQAACEDGDAGALEHAAHTLKASCRPFGAERLGRLCQTLEERGRVDRLDGETEALVAEAHDAFEKVQAAIETSQQEV